MTDHNQTTEINGRNEAGGLVHRLIMFDLPDENKRLILHAAYYAVSIHDWRGHVFSSDISNETKLSLIVKFPAGDPLNNLLNLAERLLPDFDGESPLQIELDKIKEFVYGS